MADINPRPARPPTRREALGPGENRANINTTSRRDNANAKMTVSSSPAPLPQNKGLAPTASLGVRSTSPGVPSPSPSPRNGRVSTIVEESQHKTKRNSEISNASTTASGSKRKSFVGMWQLGKTIGKGGCSTVRLVRHRDTGQIGAAKIISRQMAESVRAQSLANLAEAPDRSLQDLVAAGKALPPPPPGLLREIAIMKLLDHPNIVQLYDVWENHNELYLIMEYVEGGELFHYVEENRGLNEAESVYIFRQIVAAMMYCHRISIHHRDLKPENILIDRESRRIKLVDFGMAALQPDGKKLTTACGSPHYAAPEVIRSKPYDGAQADVWSCGVILYVMLTGTTPFNYDAERNLHVMYHAIATADYYMPGDLSAEAQDLIRKIFVPDPKKRIRMEDIWDHPFLHKFDAEWGYDSPTHVQKDIWVGPSPMLGNWVVSKEREIDKEILRNMQTLWHSVPRSMLVRKLLSHEANQEKYFYAALLKHREENLENYYGGSDVMSHAGSDYHHTSHDADQASRMPDGKQQSQSQYSILNDEHLRSSRTFEQPPSVASSYDPFRPSRYRMTPDGASYTKVTVHRRGESNGTRKAHMQHSLRHTNANRVEALRRGGRVPSNSTLGKNSGSRKSMSRSSLARTSVSRHSMTSSVWPSSPPVAVPVRAVASHKRGVSFSHVRKSSTASALNGQDAVKGDPFTPELQSKAQFTQRVPSSPNVQVEGGQSPTLRLESVVRSKKERTTPPVARPRARKSSTPGQFGRGDIRQASSELEKACEEAFNRTSISSSDFTDKQALYDTPPSSISNRDSGNSRRDVTSSGRPLPAPPVETPNTFIARTLEETRNKLAARSAAEGRTYNSAKFEEVLATLEKIMPGAAEAEAEARRITSAPGASQYDSKGFLPIISEEGRSENNQGSYNRPAPRYRSVTAPVQKRPQYPQNPKTVRMVPSSSPMPPANNRRHNQGPESHFNEESTQDTTFLSVPGNVPRLSRHKSDDNATTLNTTSHSAVSGGEDALVKKKSSWFRKWKGPQATSEDNQAQPRTGAPQDWQELDDRQTTRVRSTGLVRDKQPSPLNLVPAPGLSGPKSTYSNGEESKGFSRWLGKMRGSEKKDSEKSPGFGHANAIFLSTSPPSPLPPQTPTSAGDPQVTRSWFARFLRLRPEARTLAFNVPRARARTELFRTLRDWQRHGISELQYFPHDNSITGRVDKVNSLDIKPVTFRIELFVVLQNGKKAGLSLARCMQVKGAASSFRKVVEVLETVCRERGLLVDDEAKTKELCEIVT